MPEELVTLATFSTPVEAGFVRSVLEEEGIASFLTDDRTVGIHPLLGNTIGWVKLQVAEHDLERAVQTLEERKEVAAKLEPDAFVDEEESPPDDAANDESDQDDAPEDPLEPLAVRAFRAGVISWSFFPLLPYAVWTLGRVIISRSDWTPRTSRYAWMAAAVIGCEVLAILFLVRLFVVD
jgi:hypothetical protein